jgi:hypothetical protein
MASLHVEDGFSESNENSSKDLADAVFCFGEYRFMVSRDKYRQWQEDMRQEVGFTNSEQMDEIRRRLKL